jgi:hypothetical protein
MMSVFVSVPVFSTLDFEPMEGDLVTPLELQDLATEVCERLADAADIVAKMAEAGWVARIGRYDVHLFHTDVHTAAAARRRLRSLKIGLGKVEIHEVEEDNEELLALEEHR